MEILVASSTTTSGAGTAALRLHQGFREQGHASTMFVRQDAGDPFTIGFQPSTKPWLRARRLWRRKLAWRQIQPHLVNRSPDLDLFSGPQSEFRGEVLQSMPHADVVNLHYVHHFFDLVHDLPKLCAQVPVVWTLHDMNAFTGGEHYTDRDTSLPLGPDAADIERKIWSQKKKAYESIAPERLHIVAPSRWLTNIAKQSSLLKRFDGSAVPNGLNTALYQPLNKQMCRDELGIPQDADVLLFISHSLTNKRKGSAELVQALQHMHTHSKKRSKSLCLVSIGRGQLPLIEDMQHISLGLINKPENMVKAYNSADVFVIPSLQDNLPNTVVESLACGTPVAGFDAGGIPEMVLPGETGQLAPTGDTSGLAQAIESLLGTSETRNKMSENCRRKALKEHDQKVQADRYYEIFRSLKNTQK